MELDPEEPKVGVPRVVSAEEQKFVDDFFKEEDLSVSVSQLAQTPKQIYLNKMNTLANIDMVQALSTLLECGFVNFDKNYELLKKFNLNVEMTINHLCCEL